jgi:hypothetical protein
MPPVASRSRYAASILADVSLPSWTLPRRGAMDFSTTPAYESCVLSATRMVPSQVSSHCPTVTFPGSAKVPASLRLRTARISLSAAVRPAKPRRTTTFLPPSPSVTVHLKYHRVPFAVSYS